MPTVMLDEVSVFALTQMLSVTTVRESEHHGVLWAGRDLNSSVSNPSAIGKDTFH